MNHYVLSYHCLFILLYVSFAYTSYLSPHRELMVQASYLSPHRELMVQAISGRWCARVLVTSLRMCLSHRMLMLGQ
jgi:hypothetical protein